MLKQYAYIRVSTKEQNEDRQLISMREQGIALRDMFIDKQSGEDFERPQYKKLMRRLKSGDCLFIHSIDRLGRNYTEIIEQWTYITTEKKANIVVMDMPLLDTRQRSDDLTGLFISNLVLQILSYVAEKERDNIRKRQAEGIAVARQRGVRFGRQRIPLPNNFNRVAGEFQKRFITGEKAAKQLGVCRSLFYRWIRESEIERNPC